MFHFFIFFRQTFSPLDCRISDYFYGFQKQKKGQSMQLLGSCTNFMLPYDWQKYFNLFT